MLSEFFELENKLASQLATLKDNFELCAVKAEFEAEGASLRDLFKLRVLTARSGADVAASLCCDARRSSPQAGSIGDKQGLSC